MKIVSVVPNSAAKDARVVKQARTLVDHGYQVEIVGTQDNQFPSYRTIVEPDILVFRCDTKSTMVAMRNRIRVSLALLIGAIVCSLILLFVAEFLVSVDFREIFIGKSAEILFYDVMDLLKYLFLISILLFFIKKYAAPYLESSLGYVGGLTKHIEAYINVLTKVKAIRKEQAQKIIERTPDLIYCHEVLSLPGCVDAKRKLGVPLIYDAHEFYDDITGNNTTITCKIYKAIHSKYLREVSSFVTVTPTILDAYYEAYPDLTSRSTVLYNSTPEMHLEKYDNRLHEAANLPNSQKILLYQGGISLKRKVDQVVLAVENLPENWSVVLLGSGGEDLQIIRELADSINEASNQNQIEKQMNPKMRDEFLALRSKYFADIISTNLNSGIEGESAEVTNTVSSGFSGDNPYSLMSRYTNKRFLQRVERLDILWRRQKGNKSRNKALIDFKKDVEDILGRTDYIVDFQSKVRQQEWKLATKLAMSEIISKNERNFKTVSRVCFIPSVSQKELPRWTQGADIGIIPYPITSLNHWGCGPNKLWEYPSAGVPIMATPSVEVRKTILQFGIGWTIGADPRSADIVDVISGLSDEEIADAKKKCSEFLAQSNWNVHSISWLKIVEGALGNG